MGIYAKFWVALIFTAANFARSQYGIDLGLDEATIAVLVQGIGAMLVWLVPNRQKTAAREFEGEHV